eukprot:COSAG02_NODE_4585_length_5189_cov_9.203929_2_plen_87_part_00
MDSPSRLPPFLDLVSIEIRLRFVLGPRRKVEGAQPPPPEETTVVGTFSYYTHNFKPTGPQSGRVFSTRHTAPTSRGSCKTHLAYCL